MKDAKGSSRKILALILSLLVLFLTVTANTNEVGSEIISSLQGKITDENGQPVEGASIKIGTYSPELGFRFVGSASTNKEGKYSIPNYTRGLYDAVSAVISVKGYVVVYSVKSQTLNFQIPEKRTILSGKVTYADMYQTPVEDYQVNLKVYLGTGGGRINIASTLTDSEGNYTFSIIPGDFDSARGENSFQMFFGSNPEKLVEHNVELQLGESGIINHQEYDIPSGRRLNGRIEGYIMDENEVPINDAIVELVGFDTPIIQTEGLFISDIIKGGHYTLRVSAPGFFPLEESFDINGGDTHLVLKLTKNNPPVVTAIVDRSPDHNGWYNKDVTVSFQATDDDSVLFIDPPILVSTEGVDQVIEGMAEDTAGLIGIGSININLDKTPPVTTASVLESAYQNNWYKTDVHVTLSSNDNLSGVDNPKYSLDNGNTWTDYNGVITVSKEGKNILQYRSFDKAGNIEQTKVIEVNIDKTPPSLNLTLDRTVLSPANHKMVSINAIVNVIESVSGLDSVVFTSITSNESSNQLGAGKTSADVQNADYGTNDTTFDLRVERSGKGEGRLYTITYTATDNAGNISTDTATVTVPKK
ncbi:OmpL47-type beta-barrel domain-containing protein [Robertmurraya sp.]|uniref:OmpL47-type beta-barrel domain-containing protein n=1 Tax=Robertmurraya sp. TaxID=2837525 RepID=UPI003703827D